MTVAGNETWCYLVGISLRRMKRLPATRAFLHALTSFFLALCLLLGPPRANVLPASLIAEDEREHKESKDAKESEASAFSSDASLPRQLPGASPSSAGTELRFPPTPRVLRVATAPQP